MILPISAGNILARVISCLFNYKLNQKFVFHDHRKGTIWQYFLLAAGILAANTLMLQGLTVYGIPAFSAKIFVEITLFFCSLAVQRFLIFPASHQKEV